MRALPLLGLLLLAGCSTLRQQPAMVPQPTNDWHRVATADDHERLRKWRNAFVEGLAAARKAGHGAEIAAEGVLLEPDAALGGSIPDGYYRCRIIKLGAKAEGMLDYVSYPAFRCRVDTGKRRHFAKITGSQRPLGIIFPDSQLRDVFLGTLVLGDEQRALQYGVDETRDVAGFVERVGDSRYRLIMPEPHFESRIDVMELVPE
jgi:hypothetical protein